MRLFGFGPVSANGFGIGYIIKDDSISICASSKHRQTERFLVTLESYLIEVYRIFKELNIIQMLWLLLILKSKTGGSGSLVSKIVTKAPVPTRKEPLNTLFGGYGYFDIGDDEIKSRGQTPEPPSLRKMESLFSVRDIERKLRLSEY